MHLQKGEGHLLRLGPVMESFPSITFFLHLATTTLVLLTRATQGDPRTHIVQVRCSNPYANNSTLYIPNFIAAMTKVSQGVQASGFGSASVGSAPATSYAMAQCYGDLSYLDCIMCYSQARTNLPVCNNNSSSRLYLDGCFMGSDYYPFFDEDVRAGDRAFCSGTRKEDPAFKDSSRKAVQKAVAAAPKGKGYARAEVFAANGSSAYVLANCWKTLSADRCATCLGNASVSILECLPSSEGRALYAGCFLRYSNSNFLNAMQKKRCSKGTITMVVVAIVSSLVALLTGGAIGAYARHRRTIQMRRKGPNDVRKMMKILKCSGLNFKYSVLEKATGSFDDANKLGEGGFGVVYKGVLADGREIAVKRLFLNNMQRAADFYNEVNIISSMEHKNLVKLLGCSFSGPESFLVYEFLPNASLDRFIFDPQKGKTLTWQKRRDIIIGTAEGLAYLHENNSIKIIHRDIKASNILLSTRFRAKIADFGLARTFEEDNSHISTNIAGTLGYMAPEYITRGQLTEKADVYSFGVLLLETVSGQRSNNTEMSAFEGSLVICAWKQFLQGRVEELVDPNLLLHGIQAENQSIMSEALRVIQIGLLCTQETPSLRPTMPNVVDALTDNQRDLRAPTNAPFIDITQTIQALHGTPSDPLNPEVPLTTATMSYTSFGPR